MDPNRSAKPPWDTLSVRCGQGPDLCGCERLAVLVRWLRGEGSPEARFFDPGKTRLLVEPMDVNWARFPVQEALDAASNPNSRDGPLSS